MNIHNDLLQLHVVQIIKENTTIFLKEKRLGKSQLSSYGGKFNNNNKKTTVENKYYICIHQITAKELLSL